MFNFNVMRNISSELCANTHTIKLRYFEPVNTCAVFVIFGVILAFAVQYVPLLMSQLCVVTGASTGIGAAVAVALASAGMRVIAAARRLPSDTAALNASITPVQADVTTDAGRTAIHDAVAAAGGKLHYLVQNAGQLGPVKPLVDVSPEEWRGTMALNLDAPLFLVQRLHPFMVKGCRVLHVGSGAATRPTKGWGAYCVSKAGFHMLYQMLRAELQPQGKFY
jgi:NAD(P)-dependent dehydrogenase (short-subunit alcohol dehydrogenase family)